MRKFILSAKSFLTDETGATMVEYALMVGLVAVVAAAGATTLGTTLNTSIGNITTSLGG